MTLMLIKDNGETVAGTIEDLAEHLGIDLDAFILKSLEDQPDLTLEDFNGTFSRNPVTQAELDDLILRAQKLKRMKGKQNDNEIDNGA